MKRTWIGPAGALVAAIALTTLFYAPGQTGAEEGRKPNRADLTRELGQALDNYELLQFTEARRDISLLAAAMRANPERFDAETRTLLNECGKLWTRKSITYGHAMDFFQDPQFPATDEQVAAFRAVIQKLADDGWTLCHLKLDELLRSASYDEWERWETEVRKETEAEQNKPEPPKDGDEKK